MRNLQFPELPRQWSSHGYEIDELLGQGSYGAVYRMVRNKGTDQEEYWALKVIEKNLTKKRIRFQYRNDIVAARRDFGKEFNKLAREVNILEEILILFLLYVLYTQYPLSLKQFLFVSNTQFLIRLILIPL